MTRTITANDRDHLDSLIAQAIRAQGPTADLNHINVSWVMNFSELFFDHPSFNGNVAQWDMSNAEDLSCLFGGTQFNGDVSKWNVSKATNMAGMFELTPFEGDVSGWKVGQCMAFDRMFKDTPFKGDLSAWHWRAGATLEEMFNDLAFVPTCMYHWHRAAECGDTAQLSDAEQNFFHLHWPAIQAVVDTPELRRDMLNTLWQQRISMGFTEMALPPEYSTDVSAAV